MPKEKSHLLFDLPPELLLMVSEYLSDADLASLALCNHDLLSFFPEALQKINSFDDASFWARENPKPRCDLLIRLSHDSPEFYLCFNCQMLVRSQDVESPDGRLSASHGGDHLDQCLPSKQLWMTILRPFREDRFLEITHNFGLQSGVCFRINFVHVQLAMRGLRYGPHFGIPVEAFSFTKVEIGTEYHLMTYWDESSKTSSEEEEDESEADANVGDEDEDEDEAHEELRKQEREPEYVCIPQTTLFSLDARAESSPPDFYIRSQCLLVLPKDRLLDWVEEMDNNINNVACACLTIDTDFGFQASLESLVGEYVRAYDKTAQREGQCDRCCMSWLTKIRSINDYEA